MTRTAGGSRAPMVTRVPLLPTTVVGSYPIPAWMERLKTEYYQYRMSHTQLQDVHNMAIKAAIRDQELAGVDIVSDGGLRRDNDLDYFLARVPGIEIPDTAKDFYFDYYDTRLRNRLSSTNADAPMRLAEDFAFTTAHAVAPIKFSLTGPFSLARQVSNEAYETRRDLVLAIAQILNAEARVLAEHGAQLIQIDEPFLAGHVEELGTVVEAINIVTANVDVTWALHVCPGSRHARPLWEGSYDVLFPEIGEVAVDQLVLEFARRGYDDLPLIDTYGWDRDLGLGVVDVKTDEVESPELIATRIRQALELVPAERLTINPDCGLRHLSGQAARAKLDAMVQGATIVRNELAPGAAPITLGTVSQSSQTDAHDAIAQGA